MIGMPAAPQVECFAVHVAESDVADLRVRLDHVRLPKPETVPDPSQGIELRRLTALRDAWRRHDRRATEARWNAIPHYRVLIDGLGIAFSHVGSPETDALPLWHGHLHRPPVLRSAEVGAAQRRGARRRTPSRRPCPPPARCSADPWPTARRWTRRRYRDLHT